MVSQLGRFTYPSLKDENCSNNSLHNNELARHACKQWLATISREVVRFSRLESDAMFQTGLQRKLKRGALFIPKLLHMLRAFHQSIHHVARARKEQQFRWQDLARGGKQEQLCLLKLQQQIDYSSEEIPVQKKGGDASGSAPPLNSA